MKQVLFSWVFIFVIFPSSGQSMEDLALEAGDLYLKGQYEKAIPVAEKAAAAVKDRLGEDNIFYIGLLTIQASSYEFMFQYQKSELLYLDLQERIKKVSGESAESYTANLNNLEALYERMGQYEKAEPLLLKATGIRKRISGETDPGYLTGMNNLAALYHSMGRYAKAEPIYIQVKDIRKGSLGENHTDYATSLNNLATLYSEIGQYEKASTLYLQANDIQKRVAGENSPAYALGLNNLANVWQSMEEYEKAETVYLQAIAIRKKILGVDHADYATSLNNLATLYDATRQYEKAGPLVMQARDTWERTVGKNSSLYATGLNNLAAFYRKTQTHYDLAETFYLEALRLRKTILGEEHPFYSETQNDLALLYSRVGEYKKAEELFLSSSNILLRNIASAFTVLSEKEKRNYLDAKKDIIDCNNSFLYNYPGASTAMIANNYNLELGFKSISLSDTKNMLELVRNSRDTAIKRLFDQWLAIKNMLSAQYALPAASRMTGFEKREGEAEILEKELNRRSSAFNQQQKALHIQMKDVQRNLGNDEAAIEFIKFKLYTYRMTDSVVYAAFILRKNDPAPRFVPLCEKKQLEQLLDSAGNTALRLAKSLYTRNDANAAGPKQGLRVYKLIWEPLEPFLKGVKKIAYSPAGSLNSIAFHALPVDSLTMLMDKYQLQQYTSTRQVALRTELSEIIKPGDIVLFGDPLFTMDSVGLVKQRETKVNTKDDPALSYITMVRGDRGAIWTSLPGTGEEVKKIGQLFEMNKTSTRSFTGIKASEDNLKVISGNSPQVLHIATHGFFLPDRSKKQNGIAGQQGNVYSLADDPLLRSGIVLAGGNYAWSGKKPIEGVEDGIITAYEISQMNLSNTELLVLSACETALGDVKGSEGVFGLQRGFKMAGTKKMILSLWRVPDKETAELMISFYDHWMKGKTISDAFYQVQSDMRKKYAPFYWAAFVLVE